MSCEHPNCSHTIHSICTNHCHWSLCQEHLNEHKNSLLREFEEVLEDLIKPTDELSKSLEQIKKISNKNQENELHNLQQSYQKELDQIEQKLIELNKYKSQFNQISEHLIQIKTNQKILSQDDFKQIEILSKEINKYQNSFKDIDLKPLSLISNQCPLTNLNIFGLLPSHHVRLCSSNRKLSLSQHFQKYHHLKPYYANQLIEAIRLHLDPIETKIFPPNTKVTTLDYKHPCSFYNTKEVNGIHSIKCSTMVTKKFLPIHLKTVHHLRLIQIKQVLQLN
jgi:hypothetical protein